MILLALLALPLPVLHAGQTPSVWGVDVTFVVLAFFWFGVLALVINRERHVRDAAPNSARDRVARRVARKPWGDRHHHDERRS